MEKHLKKESSQARRFIAVERSLARSIRTFLLLTLLFTLGFGCSQKKEGDEKSAEFGVEVGQRAPEFKVRNLKREFSALSDYRGKVVLINFWATWCGPCKAEMPSMEALYGNYNRKDFEILAVSIDTEGEPRVRSYVEKGGFTFPILLDFAFMLNDQYQVRVVPTSFVVDRQGKIAYRSLGARDWNDPEIRTVINRLIDAKG